jgi:hypothetical protein
MLETNVGRAFKAVGIALPANIRELAQHEPPAA